MVNVTCGKCGAVNEFGAMVPGRAMMCGKCGTQLPRRGLAGDAELPAPVARGARTASPLTGVPVPPQLGGTGDVIDLGEPLGQPLADFDLLAPVEHSRGGAPSFDLGPGGASDAELPAPVSSRPGRYARAESGLGSGIDLGAPIGLDDEFELGFSEGSEGLDVGLGGPASDEPNLPAPVRGAQASPFELPEDIELGLSGPPETEADAPLPVPVGASRQAGVALDDLPAPASRRASSPGSGRQPRFAMDDLPAPASVRRTTDQPFPAVSEGGATAGAPRGLAGLPAPAGREPRGLGDLPAPTQRMRPQGAGGARGLDGLPAPTQRMRPPGAGGARGLDDLPAPAGREPRGLGDLPAPTQRMRPQGAGGARGRDDLPAPAGREPRGRGALPIPADELADRPAPPEGVTGLPAPSEGATGLPAPSEGVTGLPAPSDNILDLPAPAADPYASPDLLIPLGGDGGFGDAPDFLTPVPPAQPAEPSSSFFDDIPAPRGDALEFAAPGDPLGDAAVAPTLELDTGERKPRDSAAVAPTLELDAGAPGPALELELPAGGRGLALELEPAGGDAPGPDGLGRAPGGLALELPSARPSGPAGSGGATVRGADTPGRRAMPLSAPAGDAESAPASPGLQLDDMELALPSTGPSAAAGFGGPIDLPEPGAQSGAQSGAARGRLGGSAGGSDLDLPQPSAGRGRGAPGGLVTFNKAPAGREQAPRKGRSPLASRFGGDDDAPLEVDGAAVADVAAQKKGTVAGQDDDRRKRGRISRARKLASIAILCAVVLAAGGYFGYGYWTAKQQRAAAIAKHLAAARAELASGESGHWERAARAAGRALEEDSANGDAHAIAAQAAYAAYLDEGSDRDRRVRAGNQSVAALQKAGARGPDADKAMALKTVIDGQPKRGVALLQGVLRSDEDDADALLYLGWTQLAALDHGAAIATFQRAVARADADAGKRAMPALIGLAEAHRGLGQRAEAHAGYLAALERDPNHIGAQIGKVQTADGMSFSEREREYMAILKRKDIGRVAPVHVARAWALAGAEALRGGRVDEAKRRFEQAIEIDPRALEAHVGLAQVALAQDQASAARDVLTKLLQVAPGDVAAVLVLAEVETVSGNLAEAKQHIDALLARDPPIQDARDLARIHLLRGRIAQADPARTDDAIAAFEQARELLGDDAFEPAVALAAALTRAGKPEEARAALLPVQAKAEDDARLAIRLAVVYLGAGDPATAETWLRKALALRADDAEARFQLGLALAAQDRHADAVEALRQAYEDGERREDIGLRLAAVHERLGRDADAAALYGELVASEARTVNALAQAGRFYARTGDAARVAALAETLGEVAPEHPTASFLRAEALAGSGEYHRAIKLYEHAVEGDPSPRFRARLGFAHEQLKHWEEALRAFLEARAGDPGLLAARLGEARIRQALREYDKAIAVLEEARALAPDEPSIYYQLGSSHHALRAFKKAIAGYKEAIRRGDRRPLVYYDLGRAYLERDKQGDAARALTEATRRATGDEEWLTVAYRDLGYVERLRGNKRAAIDAWESYLARNPHNQSEVNDVKRLLMRLKAR